MFLQLNTLSDMKELRKLLLKTGEVDIFNKESTSETCQCDAFTSQG